ncbi:urease accessory protein UreE [Leptothoe spongobia TAU-MAC 1115]|uniref:Urease accessory protein UreE n=2 Tax=Leptothoe TaxID=2651725 RepID=A0A947DDW5_9CYAN|nr:urease accessory protein UreE [Leptothoe spongobia TAU-MAC 1115]
MASSVTRDSDPHHRCEIYLELTRGTTLQGGDCLKGEDHSQILKIVAKPEPVLTVRASTIAQPPSAIAQPPSAIAQPPSTNALWLLRAAYHLGNRHVSLEVGSDYLRLSPDPVLESMLAGFEVTVTAETAPFQPESGAYGHHH